MSILRVWEANVPSELTTFWDISEEIAKQCVSIVDVPNDPFKQGLYVATSDAGTLPSIEFWQEALDIGPGFVGPRHFPWTLSNAPAACLARVLKFKGPNVTYQGGKEALQGAIESAVIDLQNKVVDRALVVALDFLHEGAIKPQCQLMLLGHDDKARELGYHPQVISELPDEKPSLALKRFCQSATNA